jgi:hypothetical protein
VDHKVHRGKRISIHSKRQVHRRRSRLAQAGVFGVFDHPDHLAVPGCGLPDIHVAIGSAERLPDGWRCVKEGIGGRAIQNAGIRIRVLARKIVPRQHPRSQRREIARAHIVHPVAIGEIDCRLRR